MTREKEVPGVLLSLRVYGKLLDLYPTSFRNEWGGQMLVDHEDFYRDGWKKAQLLGILALWCREILDFAPDLWNAWKDYYLTLKKENSMKQVIGAIAQCSSIALMVIAGIFGAGIWLRLWTGGSFQTGIDVSLWFIILFDGAVLIVGLMCLAFWLNVAKAMNSAR